MVGKPDFLGWATRYGVQCSDGLTLMHGAFKQNDGQRVPLVWSHDHQSPGNVLGHADLENREEGVYARGYFNDTEMGRTASRLVAHGDIKSLSIYANKLAKRGNDVVRGQIRELSLVLAGANPEAFIEQVNIAHGDSDEIEAIIYTEDGEIRHSDDSDVVEDEIVNDVSPDDEPQEEVVETVENSTTEGDQVSHDELSHADEETTIEDILNSMTPEQQDVVNFLVGKALEDGPAAQHADYDDDYIAHYDNGDGMTGNVFDRGGSVEQEAVLSHSEINEIIADSRSRKHESLKDDILAHAERYGIDNLSLLFPDAKTLTTSPEFIKRQTEWVTDVLGGVRKIPFSRVKSILADITADEARARGYIKGNMKKEEVIKLLKRETNPTTIYKKQKLDRDDIIDMDFNTVPWLQSEMALMLNEEIARAILFGDGRDIDHPDKIKEDSIRPIVKDVYPFTNTVVSVKSDGYQELIKNIIRSRKSYRGSGIPSLFIASDILTELLLIEDKMGRPLYDDITKLQTKLRVNKIVEVPDQILAPLGDVFGVIVNLNDYSLGSDKGGETTMYDDFDIDFNQQKYLIETRLSGGLTKPESAIILKWGSAASFAAGDPRSLPADGNLNAKPAAAGGAAAPQPAVAPQPEAGGQG